MFFSGKKCLILGGCGFIGSNLAITLHEMGAHVTVIDALLPFCGGNRFNLKPIENRAQLVVADIGETSTYLKPLQEAEFIFNLAGQVGHTFSMNEPEKDLLSNQTSQLKFLESCKKLKIQAPIIYTSTRQVYGEPKYLPVDENHPLNPPDINGIHKLATEYYHQMYHKMIGMKTVTLRLTNTYGPRQSIKNEHHGVAGWFVNRALSGETISLFFEGQQKRDFCFVDDANSAILAAAKNISQISGRTFNISGESATLRTFAEALLKEAQKGSLTFPAADATTKAIALQSYEANSKAFEDVTGWKRQVSIAQGLQKTVAYYQQFWSHYVG